MARWIEFVEIPEHVPSLKRWSVRTKKEGDELGLIQWYHAWRKYAYYPHHGTGYEEECLRSIALFVYAATKELKDKQRLWREGNPK